jgi:hypothetical protein
MFEGTESLSNTHELFFSVLEKNLTNPQNFDSVIILYARFRM